MSAFAGGSLQCIVAASGIMAARLLGVADRGHLALLWVITLDIGQLSTLGLHVAISYAVARGETPRGVIYRVRWIILAQLLITPLIAVPVNLALFSTFPSSNAGVLIATLFVPPMFVLLLDGLAVAQGQRRYRSVQLHRLVQPALYVLALATLAITGRGTLMAVTLGWAVTMTIGGLFAWRQGVGMWFPRREDAVGSPAETEPRQMLRFSVRSLFSAFGFVEHLQLDQLLAGLLLPARGFGLYTAGSAFSNLPEFLGQSVGYVAYPEIAATGEQDRKRAMTRFMVLGLVVVGPIVAGLIFVVPWLLPLLLGSAFRGAVPVAQILLSGALIQALRRVASESLRGLGSGLAASIAELSFVAVFVVALIPLTEQLGARGAAWSFLMAAATAGLVLLVATGRGSAKPVTPATAQAAAQPPTGDLL